MKINAPVGGSNIERDADRLAPLILRHASGGHVHDFDTRNVVVGTTSLTVGTDNTVMGWGAGAALTTGATNNTLIGMAAGNDITTGDKNTLLGRSAGASIVGGGENIAIGYLAGSANISGTGNVMIGTETGDVTGASYNVMVGYSSGGSGASQANSVMVGAFTGVNTSGNNNTYIGYNAGGGLSGASNVAIGFEAGTPNLPGGGSQLYIDASGADDYPLIWGHFTDDNLGFLRFADVQDGVGVIAIGNVTTAPTTNPTGGGILYVVSGALTWRGSSGTVTTIANA